METQSTSQPTQSSKQPSHLPLAIISVILSGLIFGLLGYWYGADVNSATTSTSTANPTVLSSASVAPSVGKFDKFAYIKNGKSIWTFVQDASNAKEAYTYTGNGNLMAISFSYDKTWLAFTTVDATSNSSLYVIKSDLTGLKKLPTNNLPLDTSATAWSPDGKKIAFAAGSGKRDIYTIDIATGTLTNLTHSNYEESSPSWSPDGQSIAFTQNPDSEWDVYIMAASGENQRKIGVGADVAYVTDNLVISSSVDKANLLRTDGSVQKTILPPTGMHWGSPSGLTVGNGTAYISMSKAINDQPQTLAIDTTGNATVATGLNGIAPTQSAN